MTGRVHDHPDLILPEGTQVVSLKEVRGHGERVLHPRGAVGVIVHSPAAAGESYRVRFPDGVEEIFQRDEMIVPAHFQEGMIGDSLRAGTRNDLFDHVIFRCIIGSRAYGLDDEQSDIDYRGIYLPPSELQWSLYGVPDQLECHETQEHYWEIQRFLVLALKANPNVLECLYSPLVEFASPLARELLDMREVFLSRMIYQTYNGYVMSQFRKMQSDLRNQGRIKPKHVMHLVRLLISGIHVLKHGFVPVRVEEDRALLLAIKRGEIPWDEVDRRRLDLHSEFDAAFARTTLPEHPDYERANAFLLKARRSAVVNHM